MVEEEEFDLLEGKTLNGDPHTPLRGTSPPLNEEVRLLFSCKLAIVEAEAAALAILFSFSQFLLSSLETTRC